MQRSGSPLTLDLPTGSAPTPPHCVGAHALAARSNANVQGLFHPAVADWFADSFVAPTPAQAEAWPAIKAGRHTLIAAPTGSGKTLAAFLAAIDELVRQGLDGQADGRDPGGLRLAAQGAVERHSSQSGSTASGHPRRSFARSGLAGCRDPHLGAHGRHAVRRAGADAPPPAAHSRDHAGIALRPARLGVRAARCWRPRAR